MSANFEKQIELESEKTAIDGFVGRILEERIELVKQPDPEGSVADEAILYLKEIGERATERFETSKKLLLEQFRKYRIDASVAAQLQITT